MNKHNTSELTINLSELQGYKTLPHLNMNNFGKNAKIYKSYLV